MNGEQVTVEFQPSADQAWQFWANNVLPQSATYPSMFANVYKGELRLIVGTMGEGTDYKWQVPTMDTSLKEIGKVQKFCEEHLLGISENLIHRKKLDFMASNGLRQMGIPRINIYAGRQRPEPFDLEVNNWQHVLNLLYTQCVKKNQVGKLVTLLQASVTDVCMHVSSSLNSIYKQ